MLTSVLKEAGCTTMAHPDLLLPQAQVQQVECHYGHAQVEDVNSDHPLYPFFVHNKKNNNKKKKSCRIMGYTY